MNKNKIWNYELNLKITELLKIKKLNRLKKLI
jgi:hypothetical protein